MYRYLLFGGDTYYPCGGMNDFSGSYATLDEAIQVALEKCNYDYDWYHIYDSEDNRVADKSINSPFISPWKALYANK